MAIFGWSMLAAIGATVVVGIAPQRSRRPQPKADAAQRRQKGPPALLFQEVTTTAATGIENPRAARENAAVVDQENGEPPLRLVLHVGDQRVDAEQDRPFEVLIDGRKVRMRVAIRPTRRLRAAGVEFDYPADFGFEIDGDLVAPRWTLDGNTTVITLSQLSATDPNAVVEAMIAALRRKLPGATVDADERTLSLAGKGYKGRRIGFELGGIRMVHDVYLIDTARGASMLIVQDRLDDDGNPSAETVKALEILKQSFTIAPAAGK